MKFIELCVFLLLLADFISSELLVIGPRSLSFQENLQLYVINTDEVKSNDDFEITLVGKKSNEFLYTQEDGLKMDFDQKYVDIHLSRHKVLEDFDLFLEIKSRNITKSLVISTILRKYSVIVQSDRSVYKPGDVIKFRALVLDSLTRPYQPSGTLNLTISDADGSVVFETKSDILSSPFKGVYVGEYETSASHAQGTWEIRAKCGEAPDAVKTFQMTERSLPRYRVVIETAKHVLLDREENLRITVYGEYTFGEFVNGQASVLVTVLDEKKPRTRKMKTEQITAKKLFQFNLKRDLDLQNSRDLLVEVSIQEKNSKKKVIAKQKVTVHASPKHTIELVRLDENLKPGASLEVRASVKKYDETIEESRGYRVKFIVKSQTAETVTEKNLVDGTADLTVEHPMSTSGLTITAKYLESSTSIHVEKVNFGDKYLVIKVDNRNPKVGDTLRIQVDSSEPISTLFTAVSTQKQTLYEKNSLTASKTFSFDLELTKDMSPTFEYIAYYIEGSGEKIFDNLKVKVQQQRNKPKVDFHNKQLKPRENSTISIETSPNAFIGLMAVDKAIEDFEDQNKMAELIFGASKSNELNTHSKTSFGDSKFFLMTSALVFKSRIGDDDYDDIFSKGESPKAVAKNDQAREATIPKTWFFDSLVVDESGKLTLTKTVPDEITSWTMTGFAIDPNEGLSIAEPEKLYVKKDFFIKLEAPTSVRMGEVVKLEVFVYNYLPTTENSQVIVTLSRESENSDDDFDAPRGAEFDIVEKISKCNFKVVNEETKSKTLTSNPNAGTSTFFIVRPRTAGVMKLNITAVSKDARDEIKSNVLVEYEGIKTTMSHSYLITPPNYSKALDIGLPDNVNSNTVKIGGSLHYKLLGRSLLNVEKLIYTSSQSNERKIESFASTLVAIKYLQAVQQFYGPQLEKAKVEKKNGYNEVLKMKQHDGSFKLTRNDDNLTHIWTTAFVAKVFGLDASSGKDFDSIEGALRFLTKNQEPDGSFGRDLETPIVIRGSVSTKVSMTAFVMIAFLENQDEYFDSKFNETIRKGIQFLDENIFAIRDNFELAIVAYAFALRGHESTEAVLKDLDHNAEKEGDKVYWNRNFDGTEKDGEFLDLVVNIETSAYALLASLTKGDLLFALNIFNWMLAQRTSNGGFHSIQDTTIGIQAIAEVSKLFYHPGIGMTFDLIYESGQKNFSVQQNSVLSKNVFDLPPRSRRFIFNANGHGKALLNIWYSYEKNFDVSIASYGLIITVKKSKYGGALELDACLESDAMHLMRLDVSLPSGYVYNHLVTEYLKLNGVRKVEAHAKSGVVTLYFTKIDINQTCIKLSATREKEMESLKHSSVKFYKFNDPTKQTIKFYSLDGEQQCNI